MGSGTAEKMMNIFAARLSAQCSHYCFEEQKLQGNSGPETAEKRTIIGQSAIFGTKVVHCLRRSSLETKTRATLRTRTGFVSSQSTKFWSCDVWRWETRCRYRLTDTKIFQQLKHWRKYAEKQDSQIVVKVGQKLCDRVGNLAERDGCCKFVSRLHPPA